MRYPTLVMVSIADRPSKRTDDQRPLIGLRRRRADSKVQVIQNLISGNEQTAVLERRTVPRALRPVCRSEPRWNPAEGRTAAGVSAAPLGALGPWHRQQAQRNYRTTLPTFQLGDCCSHL